MRILFSVLEQKTSSMQKVLVFTVRQDLSYQNELRWPFLLWQLYNLTRSTPKYARSQAISLKNAAATHNKRAVQTTERSAAQHDKVIDTFSHSSFGRNGITFRSKCNCQLAETDMRFHRNTLTRTHSEAMRSTKNALKAQLEFSCPYIYI